MSSNERVNANGPGGKRSRELAAHRRPYQARSYAELLPQHQHIISALLEGMQQAGTQASISAVMGIIADVAADMRGEWPERSSPATD